MRPETLLEQLKKKVPGFTFEERRFENGMRIIIMHAPLPVIPYRSGEFTWYPLVMEPNQEEVSMREIGVILRHFWKGQIELLND